MRKEGIFLRRAANQSAIEGFFIDWDVLTCMRIDVVSLHIVAINKAIIFVLGVISTVIFKALPIEILSEGSVRKISRLVPQIFMVLLHLFLFTTRFNI